MVFTCIVHCKYHILQSCPFMVYSLTVRTVTKEKHFLILSRPYTLFFFLQTQTRHQKQGDSNDFLRKTIAFIKMRNLCKLCSFLRMEKQFELFDNLELGKVLSFVAQEVTDCVCNKQFNIMVKEKLLVDRSMQQVLN